jgi:hypothetical protein
MFLFQDFRGLPVPRLDMRDASASGRRVRLLTLKQAAKRFERSEDDLKEFYFTVFGPLIRFATNAPTPKVKQSRQRRRK